jgi:UDP:flavonoid glycosyltransferase YjiC (YdhE family)
VARILFTTFGSYGDLYPYISVAKALSGIGHQPTIATSAVYREKVESEGIRFAPVRPDVSLDNREMMEHLFDQRHGSERVIRAFADVVRDTYADTLEEARQTDAIVTHPTTMASVLIAQQLRLPWISTVLAPISFLSAYDPPVPAPFPAFTKLRIFGPGVMRTGWNLAKRVSMDWVRPVTELRREIGLAPSSDHPIFEGANSPDLVLALFSHIMADPQPDWPKHTVLTGFPFYDGPTQRLPAPIGEFLAKGPPPVVFTLGSSAVGAAGAFYSDSLEAVQRLQARAIFLTGSHPQGLPKFLPSNVLAWPYAPHAQVFEDASAIVHQGGIGTTAQALRSAHPMLIVPFAHDQFDNAERVRKLGAATVVPRSKYNARSAGNALRPLLQESSYAEAAGAAAAHIDAENGAETAAFAIDKYVGRNRSRC